jgi:CO/xanthine dehydrogenase FAD-binding subunit
MTVEAYYLPASLDEALALLAESDGSSMVMGGGTVTMPLINEGVSVPEKIIGLRQAGLNYVRENGKSVTIGATATLSQMRDLAAIPILQEAAANSAAWAIRNMATVGGNFFVPPPAGDFATALLALDAELVLVHAGGQRTVRAADFYTGFMSNVLRPGELLSEVKAPYPKGETAFIKFGRRTSNTPSVVTVATQLEMAGKKVKEARLALNAVGPHPLRAYKAEAVLAGATLDESTIGVAAQTAMQEVEPYTDAVASDWYRRKMVGVYVSRALYQIAGFRIAGEEG